METAGAFHLNLKITQGEVEALTAGLGMSAHFLPHQKKAADSLWVKLRNYLPAEIISHGTETARSTMAAIPVAEVDAEIFSTAT